MSVDLHLDEILMTSSRLNDLADVYKDIVTQIENISTGDSDFFETGEVHTAYLDALNRLWDYCAESQDNLNGSATVLVRYINAVCAEDDDAAEKLQEQRDELDSALEQQEEQNNLSPGALGSRPPEVSTGDGAAVKEPEYEDAEQPPEES